MRKALLIGLVGFFAFIGICTVLLVVSSTDTESNTVPTTEDSASQPADTSAPTVLAEPTFTPQPTSTSTPLPTPIPEPTPIVISAATLLAEYDANEIAAKAKYEDRLLEITGVVDSISESLGTHTMTLNDGSEFSFVSVRCTFAEENVSDLLVLSKGQTVTVRGYGDGLGFIDVDVRDCQVLAAGG